MDRKAEIEFALLKCFIDAMEQNGETERTVELNIDAPLLEVINSTRKNKFTLDELEKAADRCVANGYLHSKYINATNYTHQKITTKGLGAIRSKIASEKAKASRTWIKKLSDIFEEHNGIFTFLSFLLSIVAIVISVIGVWPNE